MDLSEWAHDRRLSVSVYMFTASLVAQLVKNLPLHKCSQKIFMKKCSQKRYRKMFTKKKVITTKEHSIIR